MTGVGSHVDRWHDLPSTSRALAGVLSETAACRLVGTDDAASGSLPRTDLLVVNVAGELAVPVADSSLIVDAIAAHSAAGGAIIGMHSASLAFAGEARWPAMLGGRWVPGVTDHPPIGQAQVEAAPPTPGGPELHDFVVYDERYTGLEVNADVRTLAFHTENGTRCPLVWVRPGNHDRGPVIYNALGHGVESYESPDHRVMIQRLARWVLSR